METEEKPDEEVVEEVELEAVEEDYKDKYVRLLAEMENLRKRLHKEKLESTRYALSNLICEILLPIDHMETALKHAKEMTGEVEQWAQGFNMILDQFQEVLSRNGVHPFDSVGTHFDPDKHEAIDTIATDEVEPNTVVEEYQKGYRIDGRIIRPAKVKVAKAPSEATKTSEEEHE